MEEKNITDAIMETCCIMEEKNITDTTMEKLVKEVINKLSVLHDDITKMSENLEAIKSDKASQPKGKRAII